MKRFVILSFAFLAWGFYELSGGADFQPGDHTFAKAAGLDQGATVARADTSGTSLTGFSAPEGITAIGAVPKPEPKLDVTLASASRAPVVAPAPPGEAEKIAAAVASALDDASGPLDPAAAEPTSDNRLALAETTPEAPPVLYSMADLDPATRGRRDIREVAGSRVNLRDGPGTDFDVVAKLSQGDRVMVLQDTGDGWLKLQVMDSDRIGWMADFLVTASVD